MPRDLYLRPLLAVATLAAGCKPATPDHPAPAGDAQAVALVRAYVAAIDARAAATATELAPSPAVIHELCAGEASADPSFTEALAIATERDVHVARALDGAIELVQVEPPIDVTALAVGDEWALPWMKARCRLTRPIEVGTAPVTIRLSTQADRVEAMLLPLAKIDGRWFLAGDLGNVDATASGLRAFLPAATAADAPDQETSDERWRRETAAARAETDRVFARAEARCRELVGRFNQLLPVDAQMGEADVKDCIKISQADYTCLAAATTLDAAAACRAGTSAADCLALDQHLHRLAVTPEDKARYAPDRAGLAASLETCQRFTTAAEWRCKLAATTLAQTYACSDSMHKLP